MRPSLIVGIVVALAIATGAFALLFRPEHPAAQAMVNAGEWRLSRQSGPSGITSFLSVEGEVYRKGNPQPDGEAVLWLGCAAGASSVFIQFGEDVIAAFDGYAQVLYRLGSGGVQQRQSFRQSTDGTALGIWDSTAATPFVTAMLRVPALRIEEIQHAVNPITVTFPTGRLDKAITALAPDCTFGG